MTTATIIEIVLVSGPILIGILKLLHSQRKDSKENKVDHKRLFAGMDKIAGRDFFKDAIGQITDSALINAYPDDVKMLKFADYCRIVSIDCYEELVLGGLELKTKAHIYKCTNKAISITEKSAECFGDKFKNLFWKEFQNKAISVQKDFVNLVERDGNNKKNDLQVIIRKYHADQLYTVVSQRRDFVRDNKIVFRHKYRKIEEDEVDK